MVCRRRFNEAEASLPRNTLTIESGLVNDDFAASMRPRQACLGIPLTRAEKQHGKFFIASMRPRQACLGIPCVPRLVFGIHIESFNEAEASLPRNTGNIRSLIDIVGQLGFNEAEASLPRNTIGMG